jgi:hypothetical protein
MRQSRLLKTENTLIDDISDSGIDITEITLEERIIEDEQPLDDVEKDSYHTSTKVVKSGSLLEIYDFGRDINLGNKRRRLKPEGVEKVIKVKTKEEAKEILKASSRRSKRMIKRLIKANSFFWIREKTGKPYLPITLTLTFKENITELKEANYEFTKFIRRLNYEVNQIEKRDLKLSNLKYLAVYELQERGAVHYHMIFFNLPYIENIYVRMREIWGIENRILVGGKNKSFSKIKDQKNLEKIIDYFTKYIQKSVFENKNPRQKKYIASKGLIKPLESSFAEIVNLVKMRLPEDTLKYKWDGESEYNNFQIEEGVSDKERARIFLARPKSFLRWFNYYQYDLSNDKELSDDIDDILTKHSLDDIAF